jgi:HK97 family phage major capsid protein
MKRINELKARMDEILDVFEEVKAEVEGDNDLSQERQDFVAALTVEFDEAQAEVEKFEKQQAEIAARIDLRKANESVSEPPQIAEPTQEEVVNVIPAKAKSQKSKHFASSEDAYTAGMYLNSLSGNRKANEFLAAQSIGTDADGGFLVPDPLANTLINLLEEYGVARQRSRRIVMSAETWTVPKLTEHATIYYPAEAASITESDLAFSQITLTAKKLAALVKMSTEVQEDAVISLVDTVVQSIAYQMAVAEDQNLFNGVASAINADGIEDDTDVADVNVASVAALALSDFTDCVAGIGNPIVGARNEWYINASLFHGPVRELLNAAGGNTLADLEGGQSPRLLGYPVNFVSVLPGASATTAGDLLAVFGDLSLGCYFGDRRSPNFKVLNELFAVNDQVGVVATERIDIQVANPEVLGKITITG